MTLTDGLRVDTSLLDELKADGQTWTNHRLEVRRRIMADDPSKFLTWSVIHATMFVGEAPYIQAERIAAADVLSALPEWMQRDTNTVHQAYHLLQWLSSGNSLDSLTTVVEFGGGYGSMALLFRQLGYKRAYQIYDFPEFQLLQKYYLATNGITDVSFPTKMPKQGDLLIALWSLAEVSLAERSLIVDGLDYKHTLIAYSECWDDADNVSYFSQWPGNRIHIPHLPGNVYLVQ